MCDLIHKLKKTPEDIDILLAQNKNLVYYMLSQMHLLSNQDAESAAFEALWDATSCYDVFSNVPFSSYACKCIENAINDVLRKSKALKRSLYVAVELTDNIDLNYTPDYTPSNTADRLNKLVKVYIENTTGKLAREIVLVWYSSQFELQATEIARCCKTTPSYVSRVQCSFRAFLGNKLNEE